MSTSRDERGLTLVEVMIAVVLATIVMVGLVGFYLSAQATWIDSSTKTVTQREATLALEAISDKTRAAASAVAVASPDNDRMQLFLYDTSGTLSWRFWWEASDSTIHHGPDGSTDLGSLVGSRTRRFQVAVTGGSLVEILALNLVSPAGETIEVASAAALYNRP